MNGKHLKRLVCALACLSSLAHADAGLTRLWETAAQFRAPESVLPDTRTDRLFVSNVDGEPNVKDGKGFISLLAGDGRIETLEWVTGLNAPKGMARIGRQLFVSDIDELVVIDIDRAKIVKRYPARDAVFLNDVAADGAGNVYVSDMLTNRIYRLHDGRLEAWLESPELANPNGLTVRGDQLYVASWGVMTPGEFTTKVPGHIKVVSLSDRHIADLGRDAPIGNLDGIEPMADGSLLVTDWMVGGLMHVARDGAVTRLDALAPGSADIGYRPRSGVVFVPMMQNGTVVAYRLPKH